MSAEPTPEPTLGDLLAAALQPAPAPIMLASYGCPVALRELAEVAYDAARQRDGLPAIVSCIEALTFARLVAAQDLDRADMVRVVFLLDEISSRFRALGDVELGDSFEGQALMMAELMADNGDDEMADMVAACADKMAPAVHMEARRIRGLLPA